MRLNRFVTGASLAVLLAAASGFAAPTPANDKGDKAATHVADSRAAENFVATVLERKGGALTLQKDSGEIVFLSFDDPGLTVKIDRDVVKGSRVTVTQESTSMSRTLTVQLAPAS